MRKSLIGLAIVGALLATGCTENQRAVASTTAKVVCTGLGVWHAAGAPSPSAALAAGLETVAALCSANPAPQTEVPFSYLTTVRALISAL